MTDLIPFTYNDTLPVQALLLGTEPHFVASDVAKFLGYRNAPDMTRGLDDDEQLTHSVSRLEGGRQVERPLTIINESGLYHAIFNSTKPEAQAFRRWVTGTVLPELRRRGSFGGETQAWLGDRQSRYQLAGRGDVRAVMVGGDCYFPVADLAAVAGYSTQDGIRTAVDRAHIGQAVVETAGGSQKMAVISREGLWAVINKLKRRDVMISRWLESVVDAGAEAMESGLQEVRGRLLETAERIQPMTTGELVSAAGLSGRADDLAVWEEILAGAGFVQKWIKGSALIAGKSTS